MPFKPILDEVRFFKKVSDTIYCCGDSLSIGSMETALRSGRETASIVAQELEKNPSTLEKLEFQQ